MGNKRSSTRTLPDGYSVRHSPPDAEHPEGRMDLIRDRSPLRERLDAALEDNQRRHAELKARHTERVEFKKVAQRAKGLPPEKSHL
jgi:hypothetical protein